MWLIDGLFLFHRMGLETFPLNSFWVYEAIFRSLGTGGILVERVETTPLKLQHCFSLESERLRYAWGFTWVPWFFMLSGFVLGNGHLCRPNKDSILGYVERRLVAVYPLYATTLLPAFAINKALGVPLDSVILAAQTFLLQAWNPEWTEGALGGHCWFLSAMVLHFILFKPLTWLLDKLELRGVLVSHFSLGLEQFFWMFFWSIIGKGYGRATVV